MKVIVSCGGTGGHIFPALAFIEKLKDKIKELELILVVGRRPIEKKLVPINEKIFYLDILPLKLKFNKETLICLLRFFKTAFRSFKLILKYKPDAVVGFGSYASFFIVFFSSLFGIKTIIHEQNVKIGKANRILAPFVNYIALGFKETEKYLKSYKNKIVYCGNPLRKDLVIIDKNKALEFFNFFKGISTILVMGGSLGSHKINMEFFKAISIIKDKVNLQIIHLSGDSDYASLKESYSSLNIPVKLYSFLDKMQYAYSAVDLIICRAGALTISEIIFFEIPAIIIPYPFAYGHQKENAHLLVKNNCAILIEENKFNSQNLSDLLVELTNNPKKLTSMRSNYRKIKTVFHRNLEDLILDLN
ncbi:MAG: undecaprenyldiphospho-muramoylpentapeptide beta-N-acetylglucosaminyltransferase [Candidatus Omnitrophica bacterium]|nr:undecaprenyldiphospho-muramoylpentapeptide beta-N-acetylglucosaminyltransferase [Candidatus Omnitrophota bacterium]